MAVNDVESLVIHNCFNDLEAYIVADGVKIPLAARFELGKGPQTEETRKSSDHLKAKARALVSRLKGLHGELGWEAELDSRRCIVQEHAAHAQMEHIAKLKQADRMLQVNKKRTLPSGPPMRAKSVKVTVPPQE